MLLAISSPPQFVGSSLLFLADPKGHCSVRMVDFGVTRPAPEGCSYRHDVPWTAGGREDGYLIGLDSLIELWSELQELDEARWSRDERLDWAVATAIKLEAPDARHQPRTADTAPATSTASSSGTQSLSQTQAEPIEALPTRALSDFEA